MTTIHKDYIKAGAPDTSVAELESLALSDLPDVRRRVAENERTPVATLISLSSDSRSDVRIAVGLNRKTPETVLNRLVCDKDNDVRLWLASMSYLPKQLLQQLSEDNNPHVANRAERMIAGLEDPAARIVSIFEFLTEDHDLLADRLEKLVESYSQWSEEKAVAEASDVLDAIRRHLEWQSTFCLNHIETVDKAYARPNSLFNKCSADQDQITEQIAVLFKQYTAGPEFHKELTELLDRFKQHINLSESELFTEMKNLMPQQELDTINARFNKALLRGKNAST
ncbi:hypothetical protein BH10CYA1_BH10CYA1_53070 [soil metagenome]